ncbi:serine/threonine-protein kinase [Trichormus azollae]|jgi:serine/threonine-protein kinase|uniref:non-specific serine/threonine protein kinase n=1 Tax=Nostoc azollae (strain 0708) TaxID=551115 RepID=D7E2M1_NOSA0|nr:serine/threonine-protein kinase [Trichormus azollae]ADI63398.1 serine/threonine protein kinase ['Nostoc azollae' 0708]
MTTKLLNNRYQVIQLLGAGGFGETSLAEDTHLPSRRRFLIKELKPINNDPETSQIIQQRFEREAAILENLGETSDQIPKLYAYFPENGKFYLVQEWIEGQTLTNIIQSKGKLKETIVREILLSLLPVLDYVHSKGIIHRDIKPDNIILRSQDNKPVLIDFGAVKETIRTVINPSGNPLQSIVIGTPGYMPSEQAIGRPVYATDIYSLGLTAIYLLTGKQPQDLETHPQTGQVLWQQYAAGISPEMVQILTQAIEPRPSDRYTTASKMLYALKSGHNTDHNNYISSHAPTTRATISLSPPPPTSQTTQPIYSPARTPVIREVNNPANGQKTAVILGSLLVSSLIVAVGISNRQPQPSAPVATNSTVTRETQTPTVVLTNSPVAKEVSPTPVITPTPSTEQQLISNPLPKTNSAQVSTPPPVDKPVIQDTPTPTVRSTPEVEIQQQQSQPAVVPTAEVFSDSQKKPGKQRKELPEQLATNIRQTVPVFPTGTSRNSVEAALGKPKKDLRGLWSNTRAITYKVVPNQIDLGYLFDRDTGRIRQTEAAFASSVDNQVMQTTLNGLLAGQATAEIKQGLQKIQQRQIDNFKFTKGSVKGQIVRQNCDFIYISIWDADLHDFVNPSDGKQC